MYKMHDFDLDIQNGPRSDVSRPIESLDMNSYLMTIVMFALSLTKYEIFANQFNLENDGQGHKVTRSSMNCAQENNHQYTYRHTQKRQGHDYWRNVADLPKKI